MWPDAAELGSRAEAAFPVCESLHGNPAFSFATRRTDDDQKLWAQFAGPSGRPAKTAG